MEFQVKIACKLLLCFFQISVIGINSVDMEVVNHNFNSKYFSSVNDNTAKNPFFVVLSFIYEYKGKVKKSMGFRRRDFGGPRQMYKVTCSDCGKETEVPFKPTEGRPVYCRECFEKHRKY